MSEELRRLATEIATEAATFALNQRRAGVRVAAEKSSPVDIVTEADRATERLIRDVISRARPGDAILGEEGGGAPGTSGLTWVVDPIDGTVNYLYDIPAWAVSVAVVEGDPDPRAWQVLAGAVVNPVTGETYTAATGAGATLNGRAIAVPEKSDLSTALIATGFAYDADVRARQAEALKGLLPRVRDIRRMGACSLDLCAVASGRVDAYFEATLPPWDHAAGGLIVREAGGIVSGRRGEVEGRAFLFASGPGLYDELMDLVDAFGLASVWE